MKMRTSLKTAVVTVVLAVTMTTMATQPTQAIWIEDLGETTIPSWIPFFCHVCCSRQFK